MTKSKSKFEPLSETAKTLLLEIYIEQVYGRKKYDRANKYTKKGIEVESDSLQLVQEVEGRPLFKNLKNYKNEYIGGTPDVVKPNIDIKSSWDLWTFLAVDEHKAKKDYGWQMQGYCWLTGAESYDLVYVLVDTPTEIMQGELYKLSWNLDQETVDKAENNYKFGDIPQERRIKKYTITSDAEAIEKIKQKVQEARLYLKKLEAYGY
jgi:hypothetical protein